MGGNPDFLAFKWTGIGFLGLMLTAVGYARERRAAQPIVTIVAFMVGLLLALLPSCIFVVLVFMFIILPLTMEAL